MVIGTTLGPYRVLEAIGEGGMGEVYKARDTRLDRTVAIKVLHETLASDPQFGERFAREAKAISSLNHPHICALYDIGEHEVSPGQRVRYLVMEYLEGQTLADRLAGGPLALDDALARASEIASALEKAHRAGIVHRDLKPGNIMLTKHGAKLLDFGLAKAAPAGGVATGISMLPTTPPGLTAQGTILGTFQYMAPEQLDGAEADTRSDIFAFGSVLYEMLTGRKAFEAKSHAGLIAAIMTCDPPSLTVLDPRVPPALDRVIKVCLAKDPDNRWQSAGDLMRELKWIASSAHRAKLHQPQSERFARTARFTLGIVAVASAAVAGALVPAPAGAATSV